MASRKEIRAALLQRLRDEVPLAVDIIPRDLSSEELGSARQPCCILRGLGSTPEHEPNEPEIWRHSYGLVAYARNTTKGGETDDLLDDLVDEVRAALAWRAGEGMQALCTTLGGLCRYARIAGEVDYSQGETSDQAAAIVPLEVLVADDE